MDFSSRNGVVWGRRGPQLEFSVLHFYCVRNFLRQQRKQKNIYVNRENKKPTNKVHPSGQLNSYSYGVICSCDTSRIP